MFKSKKVRKTRMTGLQRQYFREMYRLGKIRKQPYSQVWKYRKDVKKFQLLQKQYLFLARYDVTDVEQISDVQKDLRKKVSVLLKAKKVIVNEMDKHLKVFQAVENIDKEKKATIFYKMGDDTFKESEQIVSEARATLKEEGLSFEEAKKLKEYYTELLQANEKETKQLRKEIVVGYKIIKEVKVRQENKEIEERAIKEEKTNRKSRRKNMLKGSDLCGTGQRNLKSEFQIAQKNRKENMRIEKNIRKGEPVSLIKRLFFSKKYNNDLVERLADGDLTIAQMKQIKIAIKNKLSEKQIDSLINCKKDEKAMATIIDIAIMLNNGQRR